MSPFNPSILLILQAHPKLLVQVPDADAPVVRDHAHETLPHVADIVVLVQELDVALYGCRRRGVPADYQ